MGKSGPELARVKIWVVKIKNKNEYNLALFDLTLIRLSLHLKMITSDETIVTIKFYGKIQIQSNSIARRNQSVRD